MTSPDYLCIGHVTRDLTPDGFSVGGTVTFSTRTAQILGRRPGVITSGEADFDLSLALKDILLERIPSPETTTFENVYTPNGRRQIIHSVASPLGPDSVQDGWRSVQILHLGPLTREVDPALIHLFESDVIGLTPQGWHRGWGDDGRVGFVPWPAAQDVLPLATAVIVSWEDILDEDTWAIYREYCRLLVITNGAAGSEVHYQGECRHFTPPAMVEVDPTGVGDMFAAAYFVRLWETGGDPWEAARFATRIAAPTVTRAGLKGLPTQEEVATARS